MSITAYQFVAGTPQQVVTQVTALLGESWQPYLQPISTSDQFVLQLMIQGVPDGGGGGGGGAAWGSITGALNNQTDLFTILTSINNSVAAKVGNTGANVGDILAASNANSPPDYAPIAAAATAGLVLTSLGADTAPVYAAPASLTSIAAAPAAVGLFAVSGGLGYMSVGTTAPADWKQITN